MTLTEFFLTRRLAHAIIIPAQDQGARHQPTLTLAPAGRTSAIMECGRRARDFSSVDTAKKK